MGQQEVLTAHKFSVLSWKGTVVKLGMTGDKNTKQLRQCIDCVHKHSVLPKFPYLNQIEHADVRASFKRSVQDVNI